MRALIAALIFTLAVAVTASVFAIWPVVADAPWEDEPVIVDQTAGLRCEGALRYRDSIITAGKFDFRNNADGVPEYDRKLGAAEVDIFNYC